MKEVVTSYRDMQDQACYRAAFHHILDERLNNQGKFWKSADIPITKDIIFSSGESKYVPILLPPNLEPFLNLPTVVLSYAFASTRSRYAQLGIESFQSTGSNIAQYLKNDVYTGDKDNDLNTFVIAYNHSNRPIKLDAGTGLFCLYIYPTITTEPRVITEGKSLLKILQNKEIEITGQEGKDWKIIHDPKYPKGDDASGILLRINPDNKKWLPPDLNNTPIHIPDASGVNYRAEIDKYLEPTSITDSPIYWIGETISQIKLGPKINAVIEHSPVDDDTGPNNRVFHTNSLLVNEFFDNKVRTEIYSSINDKPCSIFLRFFKDIKP